MDTEIFPVPAYTVQTLVFASLVAAVIAYMGSYLGSLKYNSQLAKLPQVGNHLSGEKQRQFFLTSARKIYEDGYTKFKDTVYRVPSWDENVVVVAPPSLLPELRKLPDDVLGINEATSKILESKYTGVSGDLTVLAHSVTGDLTPALPNLIMDICEETDVAMERFLPRCDDPTPMRIHDALAHIVAQVSGRIFVGQDLCQDSTYIDCVVKFALEVFTAAGAIKKIRPWLRPLLGRRIPEVKVLRERERAALALLQPIISQRQKAEKEDPTWQKPNDMMQWLMVRSNESLAQLTKRQLMLSFAAIDTTTTTATNVIYTLAATPEYIPELREEARRVLSENGGVFTAKGLQELLKLDSYLREVDCCYPIGLATFNRLVLKPFTLSNGQYIPAGVTVAAVNMALFEEPSPIEASKFDGFRQYKRRMAARTAGEQSRTQFVSANEEHLTFGYGRHACPGRFFANSEIKIILAKLLVEYDISMPKGLKERHAQITHGNFGTPDPTKEIILKRVKA